MRSEGFSFYFEGLGVETYSRDGAQPFANVCNRSQPFATFRNLSQPFATVRNSSFARGRYGRAYGKFAMGVTFGFSNIALLRFA